MIDPRRAAALGLTVPLTPIAIALLGLWPREDEEEPLPIYVLSEGGGGGRKSRGSAKPTMQRASRAFLADQRRILEQNQAAIAMILAIAEQEALL